MTNKEHYKEVIEKIVYEKGCHIAIDSDGNVVACNTISCDNCKFIEYDNCNDKIVEWFNQEYVEPPIDWSKVPVDTKVLVNSVKGDSGWIPRHFAKYENGKVYAFANGATSWSSAGNTIDWEYAKLAENEIEEQF